MALLPPITADEVRQGPRTSKQGRDKRNGPAVLVLFLLSPVRGCDLPRLNLFAICVPPVQVILAVFWNVIREICVSYHLCRSFWRCFEMLFVWSACSTTCAGHFSGVLKRWFVWSACRTTCAGHFGVVLKCDSCDLRIVPPVQVILALFWNVIRVICISYHLCRWFWRCFEMWFVWSAYRTTCAGHFGVVLKCDSCDLHIVPPVQVTLALYWNVICVICVSYHLCRSFWRCFEMWFVWSAHCHLHCFCVFLLLLNMVRVGQKQYRGLTE